MTQPRHIAVIDIGKTNAKLALVDLKTLGEIAVVTRPNTVLGGPPWPHFDVDGHWGFLLDALARFHREHRVDAISVTTHGASVVLLDEDGELAAPVLDYEHQEPDALATEYDAIRPDFAETGSPRLGMGLNVGAQLFWQFRQDPELFDRAHHILTYPQYWSHRLTGVAATDVTSLGCHTDLWNPDAADFSSLVDRLGIREKMAPARASGAIIAIAASKNSRELTQEIFGDAIGWLPWKKPGYELGLWLENYCLENPSAKGVVLESHGLFTWDDDARKCYDLTLEIIQTAMDWFAEKTKETPAFGGVKHHSLASSDRRAVAARLMPAIRGMVSGQQHMVGHFDDSDAVLEFVNSTDMEPLAALGTSCPDHFLRTKIRPLVVDFDPANPDVDATLTGLPGAVASYRDGYAAYYDRCKRDDSPTIRDPNAVVYLIPGVGMITFAKDKATARISAEFYINAINVMRGAHSVSEYCGLPEQEAFDIEYWLLEEAKLQRMPKPKSLAGRVAFITGGAGGIGTATAQRHLAEGACVVLADIDGDTLTQVSATLAAQYSEDMVRTVVMDVTDEAAIVVAFADAAVEYGGIDILVSNAGIASSAPVEETSLEMWNKNMAILSTGYFLVSREAFKVMKTQTMDGAIVFIASKNGLAASPNASAYCTAKASEIHLARCLALEGAEHGIRVNVVNPDAVLRGSKIWSGDWLEQRAATYGKDKAGLEEHYRQRSLLKRSVLPEDIAEATYFLTSDRSEKSTGNIINVDAGNVQAFTR